MERLAALQYDILFGIAMNIAMTIAFGIYKAKNLSLEQSLRLMERYPIKPNYQKIIALWCVPFAGACYIFRELYRLQKILREGKTVYDYLERKLSCEHAKQKARR